MIKKYEKNQTLISISKEVREKFNDFMIMKKGKKYEWADMMIIDGIEKYTTKKGVEK